MAIDLKEIEKLLENGNKEAAKTAIKQYLAETQNEAGQDRLGSASVYLSVMNSLNDRHEANLDQILSVLKRINKIEATIEEKKNLNKVKEQIEQT